MEYFQTYLVDSKKYKLRMFFAYLSCAIGLTCQMITDGRGHDGLIKEYDVRLFFDSTDSLNLLVTFIGLAMYGYSMFLFFSSNSIGVFKLSAEQIVLEKVKIPLNKLKYLRLSVNSPKVFGTRNTKQGFDNWIELSCDGEEKKCEFYLANYAMEDSLISLVDEIKQTSNISITLDIREGKPKESLFESWFGNG